MYAWILHKQPLNIFQIQFITANIATGINIVKPVLHLLSFAIFITVDHAD